MKNISYNLWFVKFVEISLLALNISAHGIQELLYPFSKNDFASLVLSKKIDTSLRKTPK